MMIRNGVIFGDPQIETTRGRRMLFGMSTVVFSKHLVEASIKLILVAGLGSPFIGAMHAALSDMKWLGKRQPKQLLQPPTNPWLWRLPECRLPDANCWSLFGASRHHLQFLLDDLGDRGRLFFSMSDGWLIFTIPAKPCQERRRSWSWMRTCSVQKLWQSNISIIESSEAPLHHLSCPSVLQYVSYFTVFHGWSAVISYHYFGFIKGGMRLTRSRYHLSTCRELSPVSSFSCIWAHLANGNRGAVRSSHKVLVAAEFEIILYISLSFFAPFTRSTQIVDNVTEYGRFLSWQSHHVHLVSLFSLPCLILFTLVWMRLNSFDCGHAFVAWDSPPPVCWPYWGILWHLGCKDHVIPWLCSIHS